MVEGTCLKPEDLNRVRFQAPWLLEFWGPFERLQRVTFTDHTETSQICIKHWIYRNSLRESWKLSMLTGFLDTAEKPNEREEEQTIRHEQDVAGEVWWGRYGRKWRKNVETWESTTKQESSQSDLPCTRLAQQLSYCQICTHLTLNTRRKHRNAGRAWEIRFSEDCSTQKKRRMSATSCEPWPWSGVPLWRCVTFHFLNPAWFQSCKMLRHTSYVHLVCMVMKAGLWLVIPRRSLSIGVEAPHCKKIYIFIWSFAKIASLFNCVVAVIVLRLTWHRLTIFDLLVSMLYVKPINVWQAAGSRSS